MSGLTIPRHRAKEVFHRMVECRESVDDASAALNIHAIDASETLFLARWAINDNPELTAQIRSGNTKPINALVAYGRKREPNADPSLLRVALEWIIETT